MVLSAGFLEMQKSKRAQEKMFYSWLFLDCGYWFSLLHWASWYCDVTMSSSHHFVYLFSIEQGKKNRLWYLLTLELGSLKKDTMCSDGMQNKGAVNTGTSVFTEVKDIECRGEKIFLFIWIWGMYTPVNVCCCYCNIGKDMTDGVFGGQSILVFHEGFEEEMVVMRTKCQIFLSMF